MVNDTKVRESRAWKELAGRMNYMFVQYVAKLIEADQMNK